MVPEFLPPDDDSEHGAGPPPLPLVLRPSRRPLLWLVPLGVACLACWFVVNGSLIFESLLGLILVLMVMTVGLARRLLLGRTEVGPEGVSTSLDRRRAGTMGWDLVAALTVVPTPFGRKVQLKPKAGLPMTLAAPRQGLLAGTGRREFEETVEAIRQAAPEPLPVRRRSVGLVRAGYAGLLAVLLLFGLSVSKPWLEPWWPGRHEASSVPKACDVARDSGARPVGVASRTISEAHTDTRYQFVSACAWSLTTREDQQFSLDISGYERLADESGTGEARKALRLSRSSETRFGAATRIPGLGDEAWQAVTTGAGVTEVRLLARRANVVVEIWAKGGRPDDQAVSDVMALARTVISRIRTE